MKNTIDLPSSILFEKQEKVERNFGFGKKCALSSSKETAAQNHIVN
jgi:hypothetical protein